MNVYRMQVEICAFPVHLILQSDGQVAFVIVRNFNYLLDMGEPDASFTMDHFTIGTEDFDYNTFYQYKEIPVMLSWLQRQGLQWPHGSFMEDIYE